MLLQRPERITEEHYVEHSSGARAQSASEHAGGDPRPEPKTPPRPLNPVAPKPRQQTPAFGTAA
eukprot:13300396-Heterocapsa_arctica.AAC.1